MRMRAAVTVETPMPVVEGGGRGGAQVFRLPASLIRLLRLPSLGLRKVRQGAPDLPWLGRGHFLLPSLDPQGPQPGPTPPSSATCPQRPSLYNTAPFTSAWPPGPRTPGLTISQEHDDILSHVGVESLKPQGIFQGLLSLFSPVLGIFLFLCRDREAELFSRSGAAPLAPAITDPNFSSRWQGCLQSAEQAVVAPSQTAILRSASLCQAKQA